MAGARSEPLEAPVLAVMKRAREARLWLGCDCRREDGGRAVVAPWRNHRGTDHWPVPDGRQVAHDEGCVFHRTRARRRRDAASWNRPARRPRTACSPCFASVPRSSGSRSPAGAPGRGMASGRAPGAGAAPAGADREGRAQPSMRQAPEGDLAAAPAERLETHSQSLESTGARGTIHARPRPGRTFAGAPASPRESAVRLDLSRPALS